MNEPFSDQHLAKREQGRPKKEPDEAENQHAAENADDDQQQTAENLDGAGVPVFQVALSTARRKDWAASARGLSPAEMDATPGLQQ